MVDETPLIECKLLLSNMLLVAVRFKIHTMAFVQSDLYSIMRFLRPTQDSSQSQFEQYNVTPISGNN